MDPKVQAEENQEAPFCPECGSEESGYFCRSCGALLRGEDMVLCPRCHHVVPDGEFCNVCGQTLGGIALNLRQLALAGGEFWVAAISPPSPASASGDQAGLAPDELLMLDKADLPDWLKELSVEETPPEVPAHTYPSLEPIAGDQRQQGRFVILAVIFLGLLLVTLISGVAFLLIRGM